jgi:hypothetical protein
VGDGDDRQLRIDKCDKTGSRRRFSYPTGDHEESRHGQGAMIAIWVWEMAAT